MEPTHTSPEFGIGGAWLAEYTLTALDAGVLVFDGTARAVQWNRRAAQLLGVTEAELAGRSLADATLGLTHVGGRPVDMASDPVRRALLTGEPERRVEIGVERSPGAVTWCAATFLPVYGPDRWPRAVLASLTEVAGVRLTGDAAWQLVARAVVRSGIAASILVDADGSVVEWNDRLLDLTGRTDVDLMDAHVDDVCDVDLGWVRDQLGTGLDHVDGTTWVVRSDGTEHPVVGRFARLEWPNTTDGLLIQLVDPNELLDREAAMRRQADMHVFAHADTPMLLVDDDGVVVDTNHAALELLGQGKPVVTGHRLTEHLVGLDLDRLRECVLDARVTGVRVPLGTFVVRDHDGLDPVVTASVTSMSVPGAPSPYLFVQLVGSSRTTTPDRRPDRRAALDDASED
jgi:PAS domain S-box-containing protein